MGERAGSIDTTTAAATARRTIDEVQRLLEEASDPGQFADVRDRLRSALEVVETAARDAVGTALPEARRVVADELADAERRIRDNPLGAVMVAAGLGLVAGLLLARR
jgi:ElaB/YqjD/DUF883 family membrane-anchored ribosome-binding protein